MEEYVRLGERYRIVENERNKMRENNKFRVKMLSAMTVGIIGNNGRG